jgi:hypothetical protein
LIYKVRWKASGSSKPMLTFVETITPEAAKAQVEQLNGDFSRFDHVIQVQTVAGEVVLNCPVPTRTAGNGTVTEAA